MQRKLEWGVTVNENEKMLCKLSGIYSRNTKFLNYSTLFLIQVKYFKSIQYKLIYNVIFIRTC